MVLMEVDATLKALTPVSIESLSETGVRTRIGLLPDMEPLSIVMNINDFDLEGAVPYTAQQIADAFYQPNMEFYYKTNQYMTEGKILNGLFEIDELISVRWFVGEYFGGNLFQRDKTVKEPFRDLVNQLLEKKLLTIFYVINWNQGMPVI